MANLLIFDAKSISIYPHYIHQFPTKMDIFEQFVQNKIWLIFQTKILVIVKQFLF
jgi:hypothetical protein